MINRPRTAIAFTMRQSFELRHSLTYVAPSRPFVIGISNYVEKKSLHYLLDT